MRSSTKLTFAPLIHLHLNYVVQSINWFNSRTLAAIDTSEHLHVIDVRSQEELEMIDIEEIGLVYNNAHFKGLATGGFVSPAMAAAGERACYYSICASNSALSNTSSAHLLILGINSVHLFVIRTWTERIDLFLKENQYEEALSMALSFYEDKAKAVVGLSGKKSDKRLMVAERIMEILNIYVDAALTKMCPEKGKIEVLFEHYRKVIPTCVHYSLAIDQQDFFFEKLYDRFSQDEIAKSIFLESLELPILQWKIKTLNPLIVKELISHYAARKWFQALESIVVHLDIISLDIHQVMTLCWKYNLYDAIIYIHNEAFDDYITPLEELLHRLDSCLQKGPILNDEEINLGNKLLLYINCCLTGKTYPHKGKLTVEKKQKIVKETLSRITKFRAYKNNDENNLDYFHSSNTEVIYPYLRTLLNFDTKEFLNVITIAFEDFDIEDQALYVYIYYDTLILM